MSLRSPDYGYRIRGVQRQAIVAQLLRDAIAEKMSTPEDRIEMIAMLRALEKRIVARRKAAGRPAETPCACKAVFLVSGRVETPDAWLHSATQCGGPPKE